MKNWNRSEYFRTSANTWCEFIIRTKTLTNMHCLVIIFFILLNFYPLSSCAIVASKYTNIAHEVRDILVSWTLNPISILLTSYDSRICGMIVIKYVHRYWSLFYFPNWWYSWMISRKLIRKIFGIVSSSTIWLWLMFAKHFLTFYKVNTSNYFK